MKTLRKAVSICVGLMVCASTQAALIQVYNTGVNSSGVSLPNGTTPDPHYSLISVPSGSATTLVLTSAGGWPIAPGIWLPDTSTSAWIRPNNGGTSGTDLDPVGTYVFRTTFDLTGLNPATAVISGRWSTDNSGTGILINGTNTGNPGTAFNQFQLGYVNFTIAAGFVSGLNTLDFVVSNGTGASGNPVGLRVEFLSATAAAVPEPATVIAGALLLLPFGASMVRIVRRNGAA